MSEIDWNAWKQFNEQVIAEFRSTGGTVGGNFEGAKMILLTTIGAKSGEARTTPLVYNLDGDRVYIIASKGGHPSHPDWYFNYLQNADVNVEIGTATYAARLVQVDDEGERRRLYDMMAAEMASFADYEKATDRVIPVLYVEKT